MAARARRRRRPRPARDAPAAWQLGKYEIERELGRGAQGSVFLAVDTSLRRHVALKVLKASWSGSDAMVRRFEREAQALARLDHPGLATLHDFGSRPRTPLLRDAVRRGPHVRRRARQPRRRAAAGTRRGAPLRRPDREGGPRDARGARGGTHPSRPQAGQSHDHAGRRAGDPRLRARQAPRSRRPDADGHRRDLRHARVHGAGAARRRPRTHRSANGRLRAGRDPPRSAHRSFAPRDDGGVGRRADRGFASGGPHAA